MYRRTSCLLKRLIKKPGNRIDYDGKSRSYTSAHKCSEETEPSCLQSPIVSWQLVDKTRLLPFSPVTITQHYCSYGHRTRTFQNPFVQTSVAELAGGWDGYWGTSPMKPLLKLPVLAQVVAPMLHV